MCRSLEDGGQRCASHTRPAYEAAPVLTPEWEAVAADYASTPSGRKALEAEIAAAQVEVDEWRAARREHGDKGSMKAFLSYCESVAVVAGLENALARGLSIREANKEAGRLIKGGRFTQMSRALMNRASRTFTMAPDPTDPSFPGRVTVAARSWDDADPNYSPPEYVTPKIAKRINAGGEKNVDPRWHKRWESEVQWADGDLPRLGSAGVPLNPAGRTGLTGLGGCKRLGENKAADPIVTREDPDTGKTQVLLGFKETEQQWALPGGSVDEGEDPADACSRELLEEVGLSVNMRAGRVVYQGFVDDHRNTDNAWFATQARHVHLTGDDARQEPEASDDISAAQWVDVDSLRPEDLFASHGAIVKRSGLLG